MPARKSTTATTEVGEVAAPAPAPVKATKAPKASTKTPVVKKETKETKKDTKATKTTKKETKETKETKKESKKETKKDTKKGSKSKAAIKKPKKVEKKAKPTKEVKEGEDGEKQATKNKDRHFKLVHDDKTYGRFSGCKPKQAANKALTAIVKNMIKDNVAAGKTLDEAKKLAGDTICFSIKECTRGSRHKLYTYKGCRKELDQPMKVPITKGNKDGETKVIEYRYSNVIMKVKPEKPEKPEKPAKAKKQNTEEVVATE